MSIVKSRAVFSRDLIRSMYQAALGSSRPADEHRDVRHRGVREDVLVPVRVIERPHWPPRLRFLQTDGHV